MKLSTLLLFGLLGVGAYYVFVLSRQGPVPSSQTANNTGGQQLVAPQDPWAATINAVQAAITAAGSWAQTAPKTQ